MKNTPQTPSSTRTLNAANLENTDMKAYRSFVIVLAIAGLLFASQAGAVSVTWNDTGTDWGTGTNWLGDAEPGSSDTATFPSAVAIANQPNVGATGTRTPLGIAIDNTQADYSIGGSGILTLGSGGLTIAGGGSTDISSGQIIAANQTWDIGDATVNHTGRFRLRNDTAATNLTINGPGTITFSAGEIAGGTGNRGDLNRTAGVMNIDWGYAAHNGSLPNLVATGTGVVNLNTASCSHFLFLKAGGGGEIVAKANSQAPSRVDTGYLSDGGTITVQDGVNMNVGWGEVTLTGGTVRTQGSGLLTFHRLVYYKSEQTAYVQGRIQSSQAGNPTLDGGAGFHVWVGNQGEGNYRLDLSATLLDHADGSGLGLNHGSSGFRHGYGVIRLSGLNTYTGTTYFGGGTLLLGNHAPVNAAGVFGVASTPVVVGYVGRTGNAAILTDGAFTIARDFDIQEGTGNDTMTFGGNTAHASLFSGTIGLTSMAQPNLLLTAAAGGTVEFSGQIMPGANKGIQKLGDGTVILSADNSYTGNTTVSAGTLLAGHDNGFAAGAVTVTDGAAIGVINGATITNNTTFAGTYTLIGDGTFKPANHATLTVGAGSTVSPGSSVGTLTVGNVLLAEGATLEIEIFGDASYDRLISDGVLTIAAATLNVTFEDGYHPPSTGATYDILDWSSLTAGSSFASINLPALIGLRWNTDMLYVDGTIQAIPEPTSILLLGLAGLAALRRRG